MDDPLRQPGAADGLWGLLGQVVGECGGVRLLLASSAPVTLADGAEIVNVEVCERRDGAGRKGSPAWGGRVMD